MTCRIALLVTLGSVALASENGDAAAAEAVRATDVRRISALIHGDREVLMAVLADDLSYGHSDGRVQGKAELLAALAGGAVSYQSYDGPSPVVRIHGDTATLAGTAEIRATVSGKRVQFWLRYLAVYSRTGDAWRLSAYQSTGLERAPADHR